MDVYGAAPEDVDGSTMPPDDVGEPMPLDDTGTGDTTTPTPPETGPVYVAKIGDTQYTSLDAAVKAAETIAEENSETSIVIDLLQDVELSEGLNIKNMSLTICGSENAESKPKITFREMGIYSQNCMVTFKNCALDMTVSENPNKSGGTANLIDDSNLIFSGTEVSIAKTLEDPAGASGIYLYQGSNLYIQDDSHMTISGFNKGTASGIFADGSERSDDLPHFQIAISGKSSLDIRDCMWGGMTINPCDLTVSDHSTIAITECGGDGGKQGLGCYYGKMTIEDNSKVDVSNNQGSDWGIFIKDLEVDGTSTLIANNNQGTSDGIDIGGKGTIKSGAIVEMSGNADAGMRVYKSGTTWAGDVTIENGANVVLSKNGAAGISNNNFLTINKGAKVTVTENKVSGIRNNATAIINSDIQILRNAYSGIYNNEGKLTMTAGTIMYNTTTDAGGGIRNSGGTLKVTAGDIMYNSAVDYGGGIFNYNAGTAEISDAVAIYNNHATASGDDLYNITGASFTFGSVGTDWYLDGDVDNLDCNGESHPIDGWYFDSQDSRWEAHAEDDADDHVEEFTDFTDGLATITGVTALKAAHGLIGSLDGTVFNDANRDSLFDEGESTFENIPVTLWQNGEQVASTTTDANGYYCFEGVTPGDYQVQISSRPSDMNRDCSVMSEANGNKFAYDSDVGAYTAAVKVVKDTTTTANAGFYHKSSSTGGGGNTPSTPIEDEDVPLAPGLNRDDHYAYIVGYPEDYVTGEPTDDMSRWPVKPQDNISREEVATIFFRLLDDTSRAEAWTTSNSFPDVASDRWSNNAISTAENAGIISGYTDGSFRPGNNITRAEFATIAAQFDDLDYDGEDMFSDISGHWANQYINRAAKKGWIHGYPDGTFRPDQYITRAEAMTLINAVLERVPDADHMLDDMNKWPDNMNTSAWYYAQVQEATNSHDYEDRTDPTESEVWTEIIPTRDWKALEDPSNYEYLESDAGDVM